MGDSHENLITKYYGTNVAIYCKSKNTLPFRIKCGGLKLKKLSDLMVCSNIKKEEQVEREYSKKKKLYLNARKHTVKKKDKAAYFNNKKKEASETNDYLNKVHAKIILHDTSAKISTKSPSKRCILDNAISGTQIYKNIMKTKVRPFEIENNSDVSYNWQLISILELFQEKHRVYNYKGILKNIVHKKILKKRSKVSRTGIKRLWQNLDNYEITAQQLSVFFAQILIKVVPIELFGCFKNREIFTKLVCCILRSTRFQPVYLIPYIKKLNIKKMVWLQSIQDESIKWLITMKLMKWLLLNYIINILYKYIHVSIHPTADGKRLYFQNYLWQRMKKYFIQKNIKSENLIPLVDTTTTDWYPPTCEYKLFMKSSGLRPIVQVKNFKEEIPEMKLLLQFLQQLCVTHYGMSTMVAFCDQWKTIADRNISKCNKTWLVSCDLNDAYGSILLDQLNRIIKMLCKDLPAQLNLKWIASLPYKHKQSEITYSKYFSDLQPVVPIGTLYAHVPVMNKYCKCYISKKVLLMLIKTCIFRQNVEVEGKNYLIRKGILQGTIISNVLFDIYYSYISHQRMSTFLKSGILFRYVDDILYFTESMESAIHFIEKIKQGFTKYNCKFRSSKIQTNFPYNNSYCKDEITYLGWKINCNTLDILPYFAEVHPSYIFSMIIKNQKKNNSITLLKHKLYNHAQFRLSHIVLNEPLNFCKNLMSLVKKIAVVSAWRTLLFIRKLFNDVREHRKKILKIIRWNNIKIVESLLKLYTTDIQENVKMNRVEMKIKIQISLWTTCRRVFLTDVTFGHAFENLLMAEIRKLKRKHIRLLNH